MMANSMELLRLRVSGVADGGVKVIDQAEGDDWKIWNGDCVDVARGLPDGSLHYTVFSPPFESLYTFSDDPRDMSNCTDSATFWAHFKFLIAELYRATMPGRLCSSGCSTALRAHGSRWARTS